MENVAERELQKRLNLDQELREVLGSDNVYFNPPESIRMKYDAIVYHISHIDTQHANNKGYINERCYNLTVISRDPDNGIADKLVEHFPKCHFDRRYTAENLTHDTIILYY